MSNVFVTLIVALLGFLAAFAAAWISRSVKISEFRQKWIDALRGDIAAYIGKSEQWYSKWDEFNSLPVEEHNEKEKLYREAFPIANEAMVIFWRIKLRINPLENPYKQEDDEFLKSLADLLNSAEDLSAWRSMADTAIEKSRKLLKREWQVTKKVQIPRPANFEFERRQ